MSITNYIKTKLLNNRVEQYNTNRSYWGEDERQPRTDGINTGLDLPDALPPVINMHNTSEVQLCSFYVSPLHGCKSSTCF